MALLSLYHNTKLLREEDCTEEGGGVVTLLVYVELYLKSRLLYIFLLLMSHTEALKCT